MEQNVSLNNKKKYVCLICNVTTSSKKDYIKHLTTSKHKKREMEISGNEISPNIPILENKFICVNCNRTFKTNSGKWKHIKKCNFEEIKNEEIDYKELVMNLLNDNKEMKNILKEIIPKIGNINNTNNTNTINNKEKFNINVFLNETCKDALNMSDFIKSIEVTLEQLDFTKANGLEKGITTVKMDNMNNLSVDKRPIHCTDIKRDTIYVKEDDKWEKDKDKAIVRKAINDISNKNYHTLRDWMDDNPNYRKIDEKQDFFARTISALGKPLGAVDDKIIKRLSTNTYIKDNLEEL